jgi:hypothetical protein
MTGMKAFSFFAMCFAIGTFLSGIMESRSAFAVTHLTTAVSATEVASFEVASTDDFIATDSIFVEDEEILYAAKDATHFLVITRGVGDTNAVTHDVGAKVKNEDSNILNNLLGYNVAATASTYGSASAFVGLMWNMLKSIPKMIAWDYSYLQGQLVLLKYLLLWPISAGFVFSLGLAFISLIQGLFVK